MPLPDPHPRAGPRARRLLAGLGLLLLAPLARADDGAALVGRLRAALDGGEAAARREAYVDVGRLGAHLSPAQARRAAVVLRQAYAFEADADLRRLVVRALARLKSTHAWIQVVLASQEERDPEVRAAARAEILGGGADFLAVLGRLLAEEQSESFRAELLLLLGDRRRRDAVPLLLEALGERSPMLRAAAAEALEAISGEALGYDAKAWRAWWEAAKAHAPAPDGGTVAPQGPVEEPPPHTPRGLHPRFLGLALTAKDIVFVVDVSGSVGPGGVERVRQRLADAVDLLASDVHVGALFFSETVTYWREGAFVPATPRNKEDLRRFVRGVAPGRRTDVLTPLNAGLALLDRRVREKAEAREPFLTPVALVIVSDGQDNMAALPPGVVAERLERLDPARTVVHALVLGDKDSRLLYEAARMGSGHYRRVGAP